MTSMHWNCRFHREFVQHQSLITDAKMHCVATAGSCSCAEQFLKHEYELNMWREVKN